MKIETNGGQWWGLHSLARRRWRLGLSQPTAPPMALCQKGTENAMKELQLLDLEKGEVGEPVVIETPAGEIKATWLGTVSNGKELAEAMRLMAAITDERRGEVEPV